MQAPTFRICPGKAAQDKSHEERRLLARHPIRMAFEGIGLADSFSPGVALDGADTFDRIRSPASELTHVPVAVYLALQEVEPTADEAVPLCRRNAPTKRTA